MFRFARKLFTTQLCKRFHSSNEEALKDTLHLRFFDHLKQKTPPKSDREFSKMFNDWSKTILTASPHSSGAIKQIDRECQEKLNKLSSCEIFNLMDSLIENIPYRIKSLQFLPKAFRVLMDNFYDNPNQEHFVKLCFYFGLLKKKPPGPQLLSNLTEDYLNGMIGDDMPSIDFAIICTALYKASVRIQSNKFKQRLIQEIVSIEQIDSKIFIAFIKSLRLNRINSIEVFEKIRQLCKAGELQQLELEYLIHTFMIIADNHLKDDEISEFFVESCMNVMNSESRAKDVQKLLYSSALLNFRLRIEHLQKLEQHIMVRTHEKEYEQKFDNFVDAALSMWMHDHRPRELVEKLLEDKRFYETGDKSRIKLDSRKKLLLTCIEIEEPTWIKHIKIASPSFDILRPAPRYLVKPSLELTIRNMRGKNIKLVQQIQHLNIAGILVQEKSGKHLHVEVLDKSNILSDNKTPNGIIALKLRLLKKMSCRVRVVSWLNNLINFLMAFRFLLYRKIWNHEKSRSIMQCSMTLKMPSANSRVEKGLLMQGT